MSRDLNAFCEVLDTVVEWVDGADNPDMMSDALREAISAVRTAVTLRTPETVARLDEACRLASDPAATGVKRELLCAVFLVSRGALQTSPLSAKDLGEAERLILTHAANAGGLLGISDAAKQARIALDGGRTSGRKPSRFPEPGFARQLAIGCLIAQYRDLGRLSQPDLVRLATSKGVKITKAQLARVEGGTAAANAPVDALIICLKHDPAEFRIRGDKTLELAREIARRVSGAKDSERWFAEFVSVFGERGARACLTVAACAGARLRKDQLS